MALTQEQLDAVKRITARDQGITAAQDVSREDFSQLLALEEMQKEAKGPSSFFDRAKTALGERFGEFKETFQKTASGKISPLETGVRTIGDVAGVFGDVVGAALSPAVEKLAQKEWAKPAFEKLAQGMEAYEGWKAESSGNERIGEMLESVINISDLAGATALGKTTAQIAGKSARRVFDATKPVTERISAVREAIGRPRVDIDATDLPKTVTERATEAVQRFSENPNITGAIDDIKIMVGLPESTPAVDMTFRAIKPRITKGTDLRRVKSQMELANQTIIDAGFKPTGLKEYADAVYSTKKSVWDQIDDKLQAGATAGKEIDLVEIATKVLDRAEDPALLRTNPQAAKQLTKIAEDMVKLGDNVSVLEAERMKQLLNAELDGAFGDFDLSKHAKEAKKMITKEIGDQLDDVLSTLPDEFRELKIKYGALSAIEEDILKRAIVFERQNPEGLVDMLTKTEAAAELVFGNMQSRAKAIARLTMGQRLKKANDANELIKRAFEKLKKTELPEQSFKTPAMGQVADDVVQTTANISDDILKEAKKYKSAEEFVDNFSNPFPPKGSIGLHGTQVNFSGTPKVSKGQLGDAFYMSNMSSAAKFEGAMKNTPSGRIMDKTADVKIKAYDMSDLKIKDLKGVEYSTKLRDKLLEEGYDGIVSNEGVIAVYNPEKLKEVSLEEIWKQANK